MQAEELVALIQSESPDGAVLDGMRGTTVSSFDQIVTIVEALKARRPGMRVRLNWQTQGLWRHIVEQLTS